MHRFEYQKHSRFPPDFNLHISAHCVFISFRCFFSVKEHYRPAERSSGKCNYPEHQLLLQCRGCLSGKSGISKRKLWTDL